LSGTQAPGLGRQFAKGGSMTKRKKTWVWAIMAAQALFLLGWAGYHEQIRQHAPVVLLEGRPVDPQDLLRGDYMTLNYEINRIATDRAKEMRESADDEVWVLLEQRGRFHEAVSLSRERPEPKPGQTLARGSVGYDWRVDDRHLRVNYGIE